MGAKRSIEKFEKFDADLGLKLFRPTTGTPKWRLDYVDPLTGERCQPRRTSKADALQLWDDTVEYLRAAKHATRVASAQSVGLVIVNRSGGPVVDDLFAKVVARWKRLHATERYVQTRVGMYRYRIQSVVGGLTVREWGSTTEHNEKVIDRALTDGLAPSSLQNVGSLLRMLVSQAWRERWLPRTVNPMEDVPYVSAAEEQGEERCFVPEDERPSTEAVWRLVEKYDVLGDEVGVPWLGDRARVAAFGGPRPGEQDALRIDDLRPEYGGIYVDEAFSAPRGRRGQPPLLKSTKNRRRRLVRLPRSVFERLEARADGLLAAGLPPTALLFADPRDAFLPLNETTSRRLFVEAALAAGWTTVPVRRDPDAKRHLGPDRRPRHVYYTLRHHAASWMHEVAEMAWRDVSKALGHHSTAFTLAVYERSDADSQERIRLKLDEL